MQRCPYASSLCHDRYAECFEAYKRISTEWECMRQWIYNNLLDSLPHKENISILSVGSGSGDFDLQLIELVASRFKSVDYVAVEPNKVHSRQFKIRTITYPLQGIRFKIHTLPFGDGSPVCDMRPSYLRAIIMLFRLYESLFIRG